MIMKDIRLMNMFFYKKIIGVQVAKDIACIFQAGQLPGHLHCHILQKSSFK